MRERQFSQKEITGAEARADLGWHHQVCLSLVESGHEFLARRWEGLTAPEEVSPGYSVYGGCLSQEAGDILKQGMDMLNQRHVDKLYWKLVL